MKVVCKINNLNQLSDERLLARLKKYIHMSDGELNLDIEKEYTVYGIIFRDNSPWFYICRPEIYEYPVPSAAEFFDVIDDRLSSHWKLSSVDVGGKEMYSALVFDEWARDRSYYERLLDGEPQAVALFAKYRKIMDEEYQ